MTLNCPPPLSPSDRFLPTCCQLVVSGIPMISHTWYPWGVSSPYTFACSVNIPNHPPERRPDPPPCARWSTQPFPSDCSTPWTSVPTGSAGTRDPDSSPHQASSLCGCQEIPLPYHCHREGRVRDFLFVRPTPLVRDGLMG